MSDRSLKTLKPLLQQEKQRYRMVLNHISEGVIHLNTCFEIEEMNVKAESLCACEASSVLHKPITDIISMIDEQSQNPILFSSDYTQEQQTSVRRLLVKTINHQYWLEGLLCPLKNEQDVLFGYLFIFSDISAKSTDIADLSVPVSYDDLTGLVNREQMEARLEASLQSFKNHNIFSVFLLVDVDNFQSISQQFEQQASDKYLQTISFFLLKQLRTRDTLSRIGDHSFGILLNNCFIDDAATIANKIKAGIKNYQFVWDGQTVNLSASVGLLSLNSETQKSQDIIPNAETAVQLAQSKGGDVLQIHIKNKTQLIEQREQVKVIANVNRALKNHRFRLYFQPIYSVAKAKVVHWEVLVRLLDNDGQLVSPAEFLPAAERYGLITQIDTWVFENTVALLESVPDAFDQPRLAINLSPSFLEDKQCKIMILQTLEKKPSLRGRLIFEITETAALSNIESINRYLAQLKKLGCLLALDDFGTGVSTYSYLKSLDVDMIKIDGEFVHNVQNNAINQEIVRSLTKIAHLMGISITAEWVCDNRVYDYLKSLGMDFFQGHFISKPISQACFLECIGGKRLIQPKTETELTL